MNKHNKIISLITTIRGSFYGAKKVYTQGSCYQFYKILKEVYPEAVAYRDNGHVVTEIDGRFYDITGEVSVTIVHEYFSLEKFRNFTYDKGKDLKIGKIPDGDASEDWIFSMFDIAFECPSCDEIFAKQELESEHIEETKARYAQTSI